MIVNKKQQIGKGLSTLSITIVSHAPASQTPISTFHVCMYVHVCMHMHADAHAHAHTHMKSEKQIACPLFLLLSGKI